MAMLDPKIDSRALVIKQHTAQVQFYGLGSFLLLPLQPCSTINHKHFVGVYRTHQAFTAMQHSTDPPRPDDSQDLVLNCSVYCQMSNRSDGNTTLHTMSHRYMNGGMGFGFFLVCSPQISYIQNQKVGGWLLFQLRMIDHPCFCHSSLIIPEIVKSFPGHEGESHYILNWSN